jgi:ferredoxin
LSQRAQLEAVILASELPGGEQKVPEKEPTTMPDPMLPRISAARCTGCQKCVEICPTQALAQVGGKAQLLFPERCILCALCEDLCPEDAIALPFLIVFAEPNRSGLAHP